MEDSRPSSNGLKLIKVMDRCTVYGVLYTLAYYKYTHYPIFLLSSANRSRPVSTSVFF